jgi:hypothetical protein
VTGLIQSAIWTFRSSVNCRKMWPGVTAHEASVFAAATTEVLEKKRRLAGLWRAICPFVVEYCDKRKDEVWRVLKM